MANATETKFGDPTTRLAQTDHWTVLLRPRQPTFGSLVLICREPVRSFAEVSAPGYIELRDVVRRIEATLQDVVAYERINYLMLMMVNFLADCLGLVHVQALCVPHTLLRTQVCFRIRKLLLKSRQALFRRRIFFHFQRFALNL